jgi:hypothetical protein
MRAILFFLRTLVFGADQTDASGVWDPDGNPHLNATGVWDPLG